MRREAQIEARARDILAYADRAGASSNSTWTIPVAGISSERTAAGGLLTDYFDAHSGKDGFIAGLHGNGYIGSYLRPGTAITANEWAAYKIVSDVGLWRATREYLPTLNRLSVQDSDVAIVRNVVAAQGAAANRKADAVDGDFGGFVRFAGSTAIAPLGIADVAWSLYRGDITPQELLADGAAGLAASLVLHKHIGAITSKFGAAESAPLFSRIAPGGGLAAHEAAGGHLLLKHVGQTESQLMARLAAEPKITGSSSFYNRAAAEGAVSDALDANAGNISQWLSGSSGRLRLDYTGQNPVGISAARGASSAVDVNSTRLIIVRNPSMPTGYHVLTGFPTKP